MPNGSGGRASRRHRLLSIAFGLAVLGVMVAVVARHREEFVAAVASGPVCVLVVRVAL